tara:strand:- start:31440 stop:32222 length:783 start_codon:yes stop_codon:yes gene_type:complete
MTHLDLERMHPTFIIALIAALIIGSFIVSAISYSRQQALKKKKQMVKRYQQQADEALSYISVLLQIDEQYGLITQLQILVINALSSAARLNPDDRQLQSHLSTQNNKLNEYKGEQRPNEVYCWARSDSELASIQSQLSQLSKLFDLFRNKGDLNPAKHQELQVQVQKLQHELSTNTYLYQADCFAEQNNITPYQLYIKQAIQVIKKSNISTKFKNERIKELSDRIQEVKRTGKTSNLKNFIKKSEGITEDEDSALGEILE